MKTPVSKENVAHPCSQQLSGHTIFELCDWISSQKPKSLEIVIMLCSCNTQVEPTKQKYCQKSCDTLSKK